MQRSSRYHLIESRSQGELEEKRPQERTDQQLCYPGSKGNTKAMYKAKKNKRRAESFLSQTKRAMLPNYASWMGGREPGSVGECEVEFARCRVLFMF